MSGHSKTPEAAMATYGSMSDAERVAMVRGLLAAYGEADGTPADYEFLVYQIGEAVA